MEITEKFCEDYKALMSEIKMLDDLKKEMQDQIKDSMKNWKHKTTRVGNWKVAITPVKRETLSIRSAINNGLPKEIIEPYISRIEYETIQITKS